MAHSVDSLCDVHTSDSIFQRQGSVVVGGTNTVDDLDDSQLVKLVREGKWGEMKTRCLNFPHELIVPDHFSQIPIAYVIHRNASLPLIQWMCDTHYFNFDPSLFDSQVEMVDMLLLGNTTNNLPLHFAASYSTAEVCEYLADMCGEALIRRNAKGQTPVEVAIAKKREDAIVKTLRAATDKFASTAVEETPQASHMSSASCGSARSGESSATEFDELGNKMETKGWKKHRKKNSAKRRNKASAKSPLSSQRSVITAEGKAVPVDDDEDDDMFDDRIGDAEDRVKDVDHMMLHGVDIDETETNYVTHYVKVKKKMRWPLLGCFGFKKKKKKKVIGY